MSAGVIYKSQSRNAGDYSQHAEAEGVFDAVSRGSLGKYCLENDTLPDLIGLAARIVTLVVHPGGFMAERLDTIVIRVQMESMSISHDQSRGDLSSRDLIRSSTSIECIW